MKIIKADVLGFCDGVKRSIELAMEINEPAHTFGPIVHNPTVVARLREKGIDSINSLSEISKGTVITRAHGLKKEVFEKLLERKNRLKIIDATCPLVKNVMKISWEYEKSGYHVVIFGDKDHAEVQAVASYLKDYSIEMEVPEKIKHKRIAIVAQTTQNIDAFKRFISSYKKKADVVFTNTICDATQKRQESADKLSRLVDKMIIIGGKNSSNTKRLYEICKKNTDSFHIESSSDLDNVEFSGDETVGVTAGASTPDDVIEEVVERLESYQT